MTIVVPSRPARPIRVDGGGRIPVGGTTGQALVKSSDNDYATEWGTATAAVNLGYDAATRTVTNDGGTDAILPVVTSTDAGLAPASGGGTTNFLRADGTWAAPPGGGGISDGDKGDITVSGSGATWTIDAGVVTLSKMADLATSMFIGRATAGTGVPEALSVSAVKTLLSLTGTNSGDQTITLTSDVTGSGTGSFATTIANNAVTLAKMADIATDRLLGRDTAGTGDPEALTVGGGIEFTGSGGIQTSALTGDATKTAGGTALTLATVNSNVGSFGSATQVATFTVNAKGLTTAAGNTSIAIPASQVTDFSEAVDDRVAALVVAGTNMTITYNDAANTLTFDAAGGGGGVSDGDKGDITVSGTGTVWRVDPQIKIGLPLALQQNAYIP